MEPGRVTWAPAHVTLNAGATFGTVTQPVEKVDSIYYFMRTLEKLARVFPQVLQDSRMQQRVARDEHNSRKTSEGQTSGDAVSDPSRRNATMPKAKYLLFGPKTSDSPGFKDD